MAQRVKFTGLTAKTIRTAIPEPKLASEIVRDLLHWELSKGPEWVAKRLKAIRNVAMLIKQSYSPKYGIDQRHVEQARDILLEARIKVVNKQLPGGFIAPLPSGALGIVCMRYITGKRITVIKSYDLVMRSYTSIILSEVSKTQQDKAVGTITTEAERPVVSERTVRRNVGKDLGSYATKDQPINGQGVNITPNTKGLTLEFQESRFKFIKSEGTFRLSSGKHSRSFGHIPTQLLLAARKKTLRLSKITDLSGTSVYPSLLKGNTKKPFHSMAISLATKGIVPKVLVDTLGDFESRKAADEFQRSSGDLTYGKITTLQESGGKGRTICMPNAWVQFYCLPFHNLLSRVVLQLEVHDYKDKFGQSCVFDQTRGIYTMIKNIEKGNRGWSIDLSAATDRFPLAFQQAVCDELGISAFGEALEELKGPYHYQGSQISYGVGQPMGLYGSFMLFHLSHFTLLNGLARSLKLTEDLNFCVIGDDVVIFNEKLKDKYLQALKWLQVPVSGNKSFSGNLLEFAGFTMHIQGKVWRLSKPYKYPKDKIVPGNMAYSLGPSIAKWSPWWANVWKLYTQAIPNLVAGYIPTTIPDKDVTQLSGCKPNSSDMMSIMNEVGYSLPAEYASEFLEAYYNDRYRLSKTVISTFDHAHTGVPHPNDRIQEDRTYDPRLYVSLDLKRKKSELIKSDSLLRLGMTGF